MPAVQVAVACIDLYCSTKSRGGTFPFVAMVNVCVCQLNFRTAYTAASPRGRAVVTVICQSMIKGAAQCPCCISIYRAVRMCRIPHCHTSSPPKMHLCRYSVFQLNLNPAGSQQTAQQYHPKKPEIAHLNHIETPGETAPDIAILPNYSRLSIRACRRH